MTNKSIEMQAIFSELSETNQDILILVAKGMELSQGVIKQSIETVKQSLQVT